MQQHQTQGWNLLRSLNDGVGKLSSVELRRLLASYFDMKLEHPSKLHSAILSVAVKMATQYLDFRFVSFLNIWGLENIRPEDGEGGVDASGKYFPSLLERLAKAYAYSLIFHPDERLAPELESIIAPLLQKIGTIPTAIGYVEHIDIEHSHIHVYDNLSRHFVAVKSPIMAQIGQFVQFIPVILLQSKFKSAIIYKVLSADDGFSTFGDHQAKVTFVDSEQNYCKWELTDGTTIVEAGTTEPSYTTGYLSEQLIQSKGNIPKLGDTLHLTVFLKRGKDGRKYPHVVDYKK